jgi:putative ABC transport system permease protein
MTLSPRWRKLAGDIQQSQGRLWMMVVAIAIGVFAVASMSTAYSILKREIGRNYLATNPAAALLDVERLDDDVVAGTSRQAGVTGAEAGGRVIGRVEVRPNEWLPLLLFVVPDFGTARISTVRLETGHWPSSPDGIVLERTAIPLANTAVGHEIMVQTPNGTQRPLAVTGAVHDPSLAPAWQEQTVYGYVTPATLALFGEDASLHVLKVTVNDPAGDRPGLERTIVAVAEWLRQTGHATGEIRIPPYRHPHQGQMTSVVRMLLVFSVLTLLLSAILTGTLTSSFLAPQVRQIGVMKAIGAQSGQIRQLYSALIAGIGLLAVGIGLPLGIAGGRALAGNSARMLNLELDSLGVPGWLLAAQMLAGVALPLAAALIPIRAATRRTVRETLSDFGVRQPTSNPGLVARLTMKVTSHDAALVLAIRNSMRRKGRLALTLGLLASAGAMFVTSLNVKEAWARNLTEAAAERHFDVEILLTTPQPEVAVLKAVSGVPGVRLVEPWSAESVTPARLDGLNIVTTYPDGGHGSLQLQSVAAASAFISPAVTDGRWLRATDPDGVVLNEQALAKFPGIRPGEPIRLTARDRVVDLRLVGIVREHLTPATVYTLPQTFAQAMAEAGLTRGARIALKDTDEGSARAATAAIEHSLEDAGFKVSRSISQAQLGRALGGHLFILIFTLVVTSILMGIVGVLGLASALSSSVVERTREFGVMRALGASRAAILRVVIGEGAFVAILSVGVAAMLSIPLTVAVVGVVGTASLGPALGVVASPSAVPLWLAVVLLGSVGASAIPAWRASRLTIRDSLAYL